MKKNVWVTLSALIFSPFAAHGLSTENAPAPANVNVNATPSVETATVPNSTQLAKVETSASNEPSSTSTSNPYRYHKKPKHHHKHHQIAPKKPLSETNTDNEPSVTLTEEPTPAVSPVAAATPLVTETNAVQNSAPQPVTTTAPLVATDEQPAQPTTTAPLVTTGEQPAQNPATNTTNASPNTETAVIGNDATNNSTSVSNPTANTTVATNDPATQTDPNAPNSTSVTTTPADSNPADTAEQKEIKKTELDPLLADEDPAPGTNKQPLVANDEKKDANDDPKEPDTLHPHVASNAHPHGIVPTSDENSSGVDDADTAKQATRRGIDTFLQDQQVVLTRRLTITGGMLYQGYDRRQLTLNGFLALDSIFLGNISISEVRSYSTRFDFGARYGISDKVQVAFNAPFIHRMTNFIKQGVSGSSTLIASTDISTSMRIGDLTTSIYVEALAEQINLPAIIWSAEIKWPSGKNPYGIKTKDISPDNLTTFIVPSDLPTGDGLFMLSSGFSFTKTIDPAVIFANIIYHHYFAREFGDINSDPNTHTEGWIRLGDYWTYGVGAAFALNDRTSMSFSYTQDVAKLDRIRNEGQDWITQRGTDGQPASVNVGFTYGITNNLAMIANVQFGLNQDAPDFVASLKLPYTFD